MTNKQNHTKLPWNAGITAIFGEDGATICRMQNTATLTGKISKPTDRQKEIAKNTAANAAFIVKAVNQYYHLKEQRDELLEALKDMVSNHQWMSEATLDYARKAISKAERGAE